MSQNESFAKHWMRIAHVDSIPLREGRAVQIAGHDIAVFNLGNRFLAVGLYDPDSPIRMRVLHTGNAIRHHDRRAANHQTAFYIGQALGVLHSGLQNLWKLPAKRGRR